MCVYGMLSIIYHFLKTYFRILLVKLPNTQIFYFLLTFSCEMLLTSQLNVNENTKPNFMKF